MKRPRIAIWIRQHGAKVFSVLDAYRTHWWCPNWLWRWAVRRVDRWHEGRRWTPVRLSVKSFVVDQRLADMMGLKDDEGLYPDHPLEDME